MTASRHKIDRLVKKTNPAARLILAAALLCLPLSGTDVTNAASENSRHNRTDAPIRGLPSNAQLCQIVLTQPGTLGVSYDATTIGSNQPGGRAGIANITTTNSSYAIALDLPAGFSAAPIDGNNGVSFKASYSGTGDTNFSNLPGTFPVKLKRGDTRITTHITATRFGDTFPSGAYSAELIVRCE